MELKSGRSRDIRGPQEQKKWTGHGPLGPITSAAYMLNKLNKLNVFC